MEMALQTLKKQNQLSAKPVYNFEDKNWNIEVHKGKEKSLLLHMVDDILLGYVHYDTEEEAIEYIESKNLKLIG